MEISTTGYQWGTHNQYIGEYQIVHQEDQPIHMPPHTTLIAPPTIPEGQEAIWNGEAWTLTGPAAEPEAVEESAQTVEEPASGN